MAHRARAASQPGRPAAVRGARGHRVDAGDPLHVGRPVGVRARRRASGRGRRLPLEEPDRLRCDRLQRHGRPGRRRRSDRELPRFRDARPPERGRVLPEPEDDATRSASFLHVERRVCRVRGQYEGHARGREARRRHGADPGHPHDSGRRDRGREGRLHDRGWEGRIPRRAGGTLMGKSARPSPSVLGLGSLVAVMYFIVSGGPFGLEGLVGSVGASLALLLLVATPLVYSVPEALLVGELASMLPLEGGYYQWVKRAFGPFWGFWNGWLSWSYSLLDMAIYPLLLLQYLRYFAPGLGRFESWAIACAMIWGATWLNLRGTRVVGWASGLFVALVLAPFAVLSVVAAGRWLSHGATILDAPATPAGSSLLGALGIGVSQAIWNYSGWDNASTISGEIQEASSTYPRALVRTLPFVVVVYLLAVIPVLAVTNVESWIDGAWPH